MPDDETQKVSFEDFARHFPERRFGPRNRDSGSVDGCVLFYRLGTAEINRGRFTIRVTIREELRESAASGSGFLGVRRGRGHLIPLSEIEDWLGGKLSDPEHRAIDIRIDVGSGELTRPELPPRPVGQFAGRVLPKEGVGSPPTSSV